MSEAQPDTIFASGLEEGERRLHRSPSALFATGLVGGMDVMFGILALVVTTGALDAVMPAGTAHVLASVTFGIGFAFIAIGRSELFTENFMIPVAAVLGARGTLGQMLRLWGVTLAGNLVMLAALGAVFQTAGVLEPSALHAAGTLADTYADRSVNGAFWSAVGAGAVMTLFTWLGRASSSDGSRVLIGLLAGFLLAAPSLNHAVVSFGEVSFGVIAGTAHAGGLDLMRNLGIAILGNLVGGVGFVTATRAFQASGEPDLDEVRRNAPPMEERQASRMRSRLANSRAGQAREQLRERRGRRSPDEEGEGSRSEPQ